MPLSTNRIFRVEVVRINEDGSFIKEKSAKKNFTCVDLVPPAINGAAINAKHYICVEKNKPFYVSIFVED